MAAAIATPAHDPSRRAGTRGRKHSSETEQSPSLKQALSSRFYGTNAPKRPRPEASCRLAASPPKRKLNVAREIHNLYSGRGSADCVKVEMTMEKYLKFSTETALASLLAPSGSHRPGFAYVGSHTLLQPAMQIGVGRTIHRSKRGERKSGGVAEEILVTLSCKSHWFVVIILHAPLFVKETCPASDGFAVISQRTGASRSSNCRSVCFGIDRHRRLCPLRGLPRRQRS